MGTPRLSVIVVSCNGPALLSRCLHALTGPEPVGSDVEIIVVAGGHADREAVAALRSAPHTVQWIDAADSTVPQRRRLGIDRARGEIVALLEDDCLVPEGWCRSVLRAHESSDIAIGGAIEPGDYVRALDWAVYFCEYARFMQPFAGRVGALPANNVSYKRWALIEWKESSANGFYETFFHWQLQQAAWPLRADPALAVLNVNSWRYTNVLGVPFHHGRSFAGMRVAGRPWAQRLPFLGLALILPVIRVGRVVRDVVGRRRCVDRLVQAMPWITLFSIGWSAGELVGYVLGPGKSPGRWR